MQLSPTADCERDRGGNQLKMVWGAEAIGAVINRDLRQTYYLLEKGLIRSAKRIGKRWVADEDDLRREFSNAHDEARAPAAVVSP